MCCEESFFCFVLIALYNLPHNFIDQELPIAMESCLQSLEKQLESAVVDCERRSLRFKQLQHFFA